MTSVRIYPATLEKIRAIATARVDGHMARGSKTVTEDRAKRVLMEVRATVCEFAFSQLSANLKNQFREDVSLQGDGGWDYQLTSGRRIDIKSGPPQAEFMVVGKKNLNRCDTFVMTRYRERDKVVDFLGWLDAKDVLTVGVAGDIPGWKKIPHIKIAIADLKPMSELVVE